jgi:hypothetical protein
MTLNRLVRAAIISLGLIGVCNLELQAQGRLPNAQAQDPGRVQAQEKASEEKLNELQLFLIRWYPLITVCIGVLVVVLLICLNCGPGPSRNEIEKAVLMLEEIKKAVLKLEEKLTRPPSAGAG